MNTASIVTYNTPLTELTQALDCLRGEGIDRIYIIDNSSKPEIAQFSQNYAEVEYIASDNVGYGAAHNKALRKAQALGAEFHLVLNSDIIFKHSDLQDMIDHMRQHPEIGAMHPRIYGLDGKDQYTVRRLPTPADLILRRFLPSWFMSKRRDTYLLKDRDHSQPFAIEYMQGSFMLLRMSTLAEVGIFDERFFMYPEDIDLTRRISQKAIALYYPAATAVHAHRAASYHNWRMTWIHIVNIIKYFNKWGWW